MQLLSQGTFDLVIIEQSIEIRMGSDASDWRWSDRSAQGNRHRKCILVLLSKLETLISKRSAIFDFPN